jgi:hypothetical protein
LPQGPAAVLAVSALAVPAAFAGTARAADAPAFFGRGADHAVFVQTDNTATTDPGTVDASASSDGRFLYVQTGPPGSSTSFTSTPTARSPASAA